MILREAPPQLLIGCGVDLDTDQRLFVNVEKEVLVTTLRQIREWADLSKTRVVLMHWGI